MAKIKSLELSKGEVEELQQFWLDEFLSYGKFTAACNRLSSRDERYTEAMVGQWIEEDADFRIEFERAKKIVQRVGALKAEEFLVSAGSGGKSAVRGQERLANSEVIAAHMVLEADDKKRWSSKVAVEKTEKKTITTIIKHMDSGVEIDVVEAPEVRQIG
jgi:hypothetical protein